MFNVQDGFNLIPFLTQAIRYNVNNLIEYIGYAPPGTQEGEAGWTIVKFIYNGSGLQTKSLVAQQDAPFSLVFDTGSSEYASYDYS